MLDLGLPMDTRPCRKSSQTVPWPTMTSPSSTISQTTTEQDPTTAVLALIRTKTLLDEPRRVLPLGAQVSLASIRTATDLSEPSLAPP